MGKVYRIKKDPAKARKQAEEDAKRVTPGTPCPMQQWNDLRRL